VGGRSKKKAATITIVRNVACRHRRSFPLDELGCFSVLSTRYMDRIAPGELPDARESDFCLRGASTLRLLCVFVNTCLHLCTRCCPSLHLQA
jgi:hypothetical protein